MMLNILSKVLIVLCIGHLVCKVQNIEIVNNLNDNLSDLSNTQNKVNSLVNYESSNHGSNNYSIHNEFNRRQRDFLREDLVNRLFEQIESSKTIVSSECLNSLNEYRINLDNGSTWAFKMYDSSSRQINQLLDGTFLNLGDFQQCLNIKSDETDEFIGKYFLFNLVPLFDQNQSIKNGITLSEFRESNENLERRLAFLFKFPDIINVKLGICLPKSCGNNEIQTAFNRTVNNFNWKIYKEINSQINESIWSKLKSSNGLVKVSFFIIAFVLMLVFISTILDLNFKFKNDQGIYSIMEAMSIRSNYRKLHSSDDDGHKNNFVAKNRHYSEILVNISHFIVFVPILGGSVINEHIFDWLKYTNKPYFQVFFCDCYYPGLIILASTTVSLKMFSLLKKQATGQEFILNAIKRMINFWPILIVLISLQISMPLFIEGPLVKELIEPVAKNCERHWYLNLLFIHNFIPLEDTCLSYTWTISCELQLYLIASLLTYLYIRRPKLALILNISLIAIGVFINFYVSYTGLTTPNVVFFPFDYQSLRYSTYYSHSNTFVQLSAYFTVFLAFYLRLTKRSLKLSIEKEMLITIILLIYLTTTFHSAILFNVFNLKPRPILNAIYYLYNRSSFTLFVSWLVLQYYPNGTPSKKEEIKEWIRKYLLRRKTSKKVAKDQSLFENLVENLNKNLRNNESGEIRNEVNDKTILNNNEIDSTVKRKVSSSESISDLSDYSSLQNDLVDHIEVQDKNNNADFYNKKLINFTEKQIERSTEDERILKLPDKLDDKLDDKNIEKATSYKKDLNVSNKKSNLGVWVKLSRSIYYSHFFYLLYSLFNVNNAQKSDFISMAISVHSKLFWAYMLAYLFHLLIEGAITNLTQKLTQMILAEKVHKD